MRQLRSSLHRGAVSKHRRSREADRLSRSLGEVQLSTAPRPLGPLISAVLTSSIRKSPASPLLHGQPFSPVTGCIHKYSLFADCIYVHVCVCVCGRFRHTPAHLQRRGVGRKTGGHGSGRCVCRVASETHPSLQEMTVCRLQLFMQIQQILLILRGLAILSNYQKISTLFLCGLKIRGFKP